MKLLKPPLAAKLAALKDGFWVRWATMLILGILSLLALQRLAR